MGQKNVLQTTDRSVGIAPFAAPIPKTLASDYGPAVSAPHQAQLNHIYSMYLKHQFKRLFHNEMEYTYLAALMPITYARTSKLVDINM